MPIHDSQTGKTFLFYNDNEYNRRTDCYIIESVDGGKTWSSPVDITADLCKYSEPLEFHLLDRATVYSFTAEPMMAG